MTPGDVPYKNTGNLYIDRVKPILQTRCYRCHAGLNRESGLRVDSRAYMLKGGKHGTALVPGDPEKSLMIKLVRHEGPKDDPMPMPNRRGKLPEQEIRDLERSLGAPEAPDHARRTQNPLDAPIHASLSYPFCSQ